MVSSIAATALVGTVLVTGRSPHWRAACTCAHIGLAQDSDHVVASITFNAFVLLMFGTSSTCCFDSSITATLVWQALLVHKAEAYVAARALMHTILRASSSSGSSSRCTSTYVDFALVSFFVTSCGATSTLVSLVGGACKFDRR
jgi:hypothetical protein